MEPELAIVVAEVRRKCLSEENRLQKNPDFLGGSENLRTLTLHVALTGRLAGSGLGVCGLILE